MRRKIERTHVRRMLAVAIVCSLGPLATFANEEHILKTCAGVRVNSLDVSAETAVDWPLNTKPEIVAAPKASVPGAKRNASVVIAYGPILASANNAPDLKTDLACTPQGISLVVTMTHLGDGDASKNALWRPKITLTVSGRRQNAVFVTIWKMRGQDNAEVTHVQTPPYPEQQYPVVVRTRLFSTARR
jgi:hypothetical protein